MNTNGSYAVTPVTNVTFATISCQTCHEPHGQTVPTNNPHLIRAMGAVTMPDGTVVTNAGEGAVCLECHQNRNGSATNQLVNYPHWAKAPGSAAPASACTTTRRAT